HQLITPRSHCEFLCLQEFLGDTHAHSSSLPRLCGDQPPQRLDGYVQYESSGSAGSTVQCEDRMKFKSGLVVRTYMPGRSMQQTHRSEQKTPAFYCWGSS